MHTTLKSMLVGTASFVALTAAVHASAQATADTADQASASSDGLKEIVVTARRREEKAQTVPIVIDVLSQKVLQEQEIRTPQDLSHDIPGLSVQSSFRGQSALMWIRGVPGVITYFADVPTALAFGAFYFDLDNVQALKGPQGTLFGLNADAGAILFQPKKPTGDFEGFAQVTLGDYNRHTFDGVANIPVVPDKLLVRVGGEYSHTDGFQYDETQKKYLYDDDHWIGRLSAILRPADDFENYFVANYYYYHSDGGNLFPVGVNSAGLAGRFFPTAAADVAQQLALGPYTSLGSSIAGGTVLLNKQLNVVNTTRWDIDENLTLKNIAGYSEQTNFSRLDYDGTPLPIFDVGSGNTQPSGPLATYSDEVQFLGKSLNDRLNWVVGSFLSFNHTTAPQPNFQVALGGRSGTLTGTSGRTQAVYTQGTYDLSDFVEGLSFTAGYRYSWDWRSAFQNSLNGTGQTLIKYASDGQFHAPGYTFSLDYQVTQSVLTYVNYSKAYSSGGFNLAAPVQFQKFGPEYLAEIEAGVKADWVLGGIKARTNFGGFYGWYDNIQASTTVSYTDAAGVHVAVETLNAATAHIEGIETEFTVSPVEGVEISGNGILMDAKYDQYVSNGVNLNNTPFYLLPQLKYTLRGQYRLPVGADWGDLSVAANYTWQRHLTRNTDPGVLGLLQSFQTLDLNVDWNDIAGRPVDASFFMTNVTNNQANMGGFGAYTALGLASVGVPDPRMYGFRLRYRFGPGRSLN